MMMFASLVFRLVLLFIVNTKRKVSVSRVSRVVMFAYLSTVEHGLVDSAIRNRSSAFLLQCCAPFRCHLYKVIITFSLISHEKIIQRIPITNVNCHWWVWILFSFGFLTGPSVCIKYLTHCSEWEVEVFWLSSTCSKHKLFIWKVNRKVGMESGQQRSCVRFRDLAVQYLLIVIQMLTSSIKIQVTVMRNWSVE